MAVSPETVSSCLRCLPGCIKSSVTCPFHHCSCVSLDKSSWPVHVQNTCFLRAQQNASIGAAKKAAGGLARTRCTTSGVFYLLPLTRSTNLKGNVSVGSDFLPFISSDEPSYMGILSGTSLPALFRQHFPLIPSSLNPDTQTQAEEHQPHPSWWISTDSGRCFCLVCLFGLFFSRGKEIKFTLQMNQGSNP